MVDVMRDKYGIDCSEPNMEVVTKVDLDKCIDIVDSAIRGLGSQKSQAKVLRDDY